MTNISFSRPEIDPNKITMFGPIPQLGGGDNNREEREFITPEGSTRALELLHQQCIGRVLKVRGLE